MNVTLCRICREAIPAGEYHACAISLPHPQPSKYDRLFKDIISDGWCVKSDGHVESPVGYFAIVEIPSHHGELNEMKDAVTDADEYDWPPAGWYFTVENSDGIICVYSVDKQAAELLYEAWLADFSAWDND